MPRGQLNGAIFDEFYHKVISVIFRSMDGVIIHHISGI